MLTAILICGLNVFSSCIGSDNPVSPANPASSLKIVGNWFSDVSGMTFAKWNYGKTWQNTEFKTDLNKIKETGLQAISMGEEAKQLKICNPNTMRMFLEFSSLQCPAEDYVMGIWGHGSAFDPMLDVPGKYEVQQARATRGVMTDEWVDGEWMDMYQMHDAMQAAGIKKFNTLMFHNCYMGNMETLTQAYNFADYIFASARLRRPTTPSLKLSPPRWTMPSRRLSFTTAT